MVQKLNCHSIQIVFKFLMLIILCGCYMLLAICSMSILLGEVGREGTQSCYNLYAFGTHIDPPFQIHVVHLIIGMFICFN